MFVTEIALLLMYVGAPLLALVALLVMFRWKARISGEMRWYAIEWGKLCDRDTGIDTYAKTVDRLKKDLEELRDNHENAYTQFKKFRSRVTMQQRRLVEEDTPAPDGEARQPNETTEAWKIRMRLKHLR